MEGDSKIDVWEEKKRREILVLPSYLLNAFEISDAI